MSIVFRESYDAAVKLYTGIKDLANAKGDKSKISKAFRSITDANTALGDNKAGLFVKTIAWLFSGRKGVSTGMALAGKTANPELKNAMAVAATHFGNENQTVKALTQMAVSLGKEESNECKVNDLKSAAKTLTGRQIAEVLIRSRTGKENQYKDRSSRFKNVVKSLIEGIKINNKDETKALHTALVGTVERIDYTDGPPSGRLVSGENLKTDEKQEMLTLFLSKCKGKIRKSDIGYFALSFSHFLGKDKGDLQIMLEASAAPSKSRGHISETASKDGPPVKSMTTDAAPAKKGEMNPSRPLPNASQWIGLGNVMKMSGQDYKQFILQTFQKQPQRDEQLSILLAIASDGELSEDQLNTLQEMADPLTHLESGDFDVVRELIQKRTP